MINPEQGRRPAQRIGGEVEAMRVPKAALPTLELGGLRSGARVEAMQPRLEEPQQTFGTAEQQEEDSRDVELERQLANAGAEGMTYRGPQDRDPALPPLPENLIRVTNSS